MGTVFEVNRTRDGRRFALKVVTTARTGGSLARLAREAEVAGKIVHPNLVSIVDVDVSQKGELYIVMELVEGSPLGEAYARFGDTRWALAILAQIARGLAALHAGGIVHRDLKPGNVLLSNAAPIPLAKIADFGLARLSRAPTNPVIDVPAAAAAQAVAEQAPSSSDSSIASAPTLAAATPPAGAPSGDLTEHGAIMGTPLYMAPELNAGARDAPPSSDIWSFGVVAYQLLVGAPPFTSASARATAEARAKAEHAFAKLDLPTSIATTLARALSIDPRERPSAAELAEVLG
jgi:serine/threonine protein kinase